MKKVENLQGLKLHDDVITRLQPIFWRIERGKYRELFIEEKTTSNLLRFNC